MVEPRHITDVSLRPPPPTPRRPSPTATSSSAASAASTRGAGGHRPASLPRPAVAGGRGHAADPVGHDQIPPVPRAAADAGGARRRRPPGPRHPRAPGMNTSDSFDRTVSEWLHADAEHRVPDHLDAVLRRTRTERQRPAWSSLERWLPVQTTLRLAPVPRVAWLASRRRSRRRRRAGRPRGRLAAPRLPAPFGLARNGTVLYGGTDDDIYHARSRHRRNDRPDRRLGGRPRRRSSRRTGPSCSSFGADPTDQGCRLTVLCSRC